MPISGKKLVKLLRKKAGAFQELQEACYIMEKGKDTISIPVHGNTSLGKGLESKLFKAAGVRKK